MSRPIHILLVDDDAHTREGYREFFALKGWSAHTAADGEAALRALSSVATDVMVLDLELPMIDGWEVARRVKLLHPNTRIIALSAHTSQSQRASAARAGCDLFLPKPCSPHRLVEQVQRVLASQQIRP
jgi:two-component system cell cycle response regulator DivK